MKYQSATARTNNYVNNKKMKQNCKIHFKENNDDLTFQRMPDCSAQFDVYS